MHKKYFFSAARNFCFKGFLLLDKINIVENLLMRIKTFSRICDEHCAGNKILGAIIAKIRYGYFPLPRHSSWFCRKILVIQYFLSEVLCCIIYDLHGALLVLVIFLAKPT